MKVRSVLHPFLLPAVLLVLSTDLLSQGIGDRNRAADGDGRYSIQGRVYLPDGKAAVNAKIFINSADSIAIRSITDINGMFQVGSLRAGNYSIFVRVAGYPAESETVIIDRFAPAGRTFSIVLNLRGERPAAEPAPQDKRLDGVPKGAAEKFRKGLEKRDQKDLRAADALYDEAIAIYPKFAAAYFEKGLAGLKENDIDRALPHFVKAIELDPDFLEAKYSVGYVHYLKKNYEVASAVFVDVLKQKRDFAEAFMYLGISLYYLKDTTSAETALRSALLIKDDASIALAHRFLGGMYLQSKRNAEAAAQLRKYLELVPAAPDADRIRTTIEELKKGS